MNYGLTAPLLLNGFVCTTRATVRPRLTVARIQATVADFYNIHLSEMTSDRRDATVVRPRQIAMYLARRLTPKSVPRIGHYFKRDHTTVLYAVKRVAALMSVDGEIADDVQTLTARLAA